MQDLLLFHARADQLYLLFNHRIWRSFPQELQHLHCFPIPPLRNQPSRRLGQDEPANDHEYWNYELQDEHDPVGPLIGSFVHGIVNNHSDQTAEEEHELVGVDKGAAPFGRGDFAEVDGDDTVQRADVSARY